MLTHSDRYVMYLDPELLHFMYLSYSETRNYPVMNKLYSLLNEGYVNNLIVTPISFDHILPYVDNNKIEIEFFNMMGNIGQIQFHQRFTIRILQLIRIINTYFDQKYKKPNWKDAFSADPDEKYSTGFNRYLSISALNVLEAAEREKNNSQIYFFIENFKQGKPIESIVRDYYLKLCDKFYDLIKPYLPIAAAPDYYIKKLLDYEGISEIPEFQIISNILYPLFETYGIDHVEQGSSDEILLKTEIAAAYIPYCDFYITSVDVADFIVKKKIDELYAVRVYDHNEKSLYRLIDDLSEAVRQKRIEDNRKQTKTVFRKNQF